MTIYATKISAAEREWLERYENTTGFEPMFQDEIDSGETTFFQAAQENIKWFEDWSSDAMLGITRKVPSDPDEHATPTEAGNGGEA